MSDIHAFTEIYWGACLNIMWANTTLNRDLVPVMAAARRAARTQLMRTCVNNGVPREAIAALVKSTESRALSFIKASGPELERIKRTNSRILQEQREQREQREEQELLLELEAAA